VEWTRHEWKEACSPNPPQTEPNLVTRRTNDAGQEEEETVANQIDLGSVNMFFGPIFRMSDCSRACGVR